MDGTLHIVATPIGNLEDITLRALKILKESDVILAEDTRVTNKLLSWLNSKSQIPIYKLEKNNSLRPASDRQKLLSYHQHSGEQKKLEILNLLIEGKNIALVTDAGTPGISDPGNELIDYLLSYAPDIKIIPIPGASAITTALSVAGFNVNKFVFLGFLPKKKRQKLFDWLKDGCSAFSGRTLTFAFFESPNRILRSLEMIEKVFGGHIRVFVARELTKLYETTYRGSIREVHAMLEKEKVKGECVVVVEL